jgi:hypothetical protein
LDPFYKLNLSEDLIKVSKEYIVKLVNEERDFVEHAQLDDTVLEVEEAEVVLQDPKLVLSGFTKLSKVIASKSKLGPESEKNATTNKDLLEKEFEIYERNAERVLNKAILVKLKRNTSSNVISWLLRWLVRAGSKRTGLGLRTRGPSSSLRTN